MKKSVVLLVGSLFCAGLASAACVDCNDAKTASEKAICNSQELTALNNELTKVYDAACAQYKDSPVFQTIVRGNNSMREECKDDACLKQWLEGSIKLYQDIKAGYPSSIVSTCTYPEEVQKLCQNAKSEEEMKKCAAAQLQSDETTLEKCYQTVLASKISDADKDVLNKFFTQWKIDRDKYCGLYYSGSPASEVAVTNCMRNWTMSLAARLQYIDDEKWISNLMESVQKCVK